ncbi:MAG: hypothetical protein R3256_13830, partial [Thalassovita sp.]|nr:hypothetical protein [Thalassovita sp.]
MRDLKAFEGVNRRRIRDTLDGQDKALGQWVAIALHGLIVLTAVAFAASTMPNLPDHARLILLWF